MNKISLSSNQSLSANSEQNITKSGHKLTAKTNETKDRDIADKTVSNSINNESKLINKKVLILGEKA